MGKYKNLFLSSFVGTSGALGAIAGSIGIGLLLGILGLILVMNEKKKSNESRNTVLLVIGFILMALGVMFGLGFNAEGLISGIKNEL